MALMSSLALEGGLPGAAIDELPEEIGERQLQARCRFTQFEQRLRVGDGGAIFNWLRMMPASSSSFLPWPLCSAQSFDIETVKRAAVVLALGEHRLPGESLPARLRGSASRTSCARQSRARPLFVVVLLVEVGRQSPKASLFSLALSTVAAGDFLAAMLFSLISVRGVLRQAQDERRIDSHCESSIGVHGSTGFWAAFQRMSPCSQKIKHGAVGDFPSNSRPGRRK